MKSLSWAAWVVFASLSFGGCLGSTEPSDIGGLLVRVATSGNNLPDGYTLEVEGFDQTADVAPTGDVTFAPVPVGSISVQLTDVPANCSVSGANPRTVVIEKDTVTDTTFSVLCT